MSPIGEAQEIHGLLLRDRGDYPLIDVRVGYQVKGITLNEATIDAPVEEPFDPPVLRLYVALG